MSNGSKKPFKPIDPDQVPGTESAEQSADYVVTGIYGLLQGLKGPERKKALRQILKNRDEIVFQRLEQMTTHAKRLLEQQQIRYTHMQAQSQKSWPLTALQYIEQLTPIPIEAESMFPIPKNARHLRTLHPAAPPPAEAPKSYWADELPDSHPQGIQVQGTPVITETVQITHEIPEAVPSPLVEQLPDGVSEKQVVAPEAPIQPEKAEEIVQADLKSDTQRKTGTEDYYKEREKRVSEAIEKTRKKGGTDVSL